MISSSNLAKKKRRFSSEQISFQSIPLRHNDSLAIPTITKFHKVEHKKSGARKSMDFDRINRYEQNLGSMKRQTDWSKHKIDSIQFQKILQKRKQKAKFNFKTVDLKSIQHRSLNSVIESYTSENMQHSGLQFQLQNQKKFSLEKQTSQITQFQKQLKQLKQKEVEQKTKNSILNELISLVKSQVAQNEQKQHQSDRTISKSEKFHKAIKKVQQKKDFFIRLNNQIHQKILQYQKEIFSMRSERVVYSSIFKELQKEVKYTENLFKQTLITSFQYYYSFEAFRLYQNGVHYGQAFQRSDSPMNSFTEYKNFLSTMIKASGVKFIGNFNYYNEEEQLQDRINSNSALNYYTQSRKVIILPRYKEHYQSSRKKIKLEKEENSYEELCNQINRFFQTLELSEYSESDLNEDDKKSDLRKLQKAFSTSIYNKGSLQTFTSKKNQLIRQLSSNKDGGSSLSSSLQNFDVSAQSSINKVKKMIFQLPAKNDQLFLNIQNLDKQIEKTQNKIQEEKTKHKVFQNTESAFRISSSKEVENLQKILGSVNQKSLFEVKQKRSKDEEEIQKILNLFQIEQSSSAESRLVTTLNKLEEFYITTKTSKLFETPDLGNSNNSEVKNNLLDTDRSTISIKFKKIDQNVSSIDQSDKKDIVTRGPKTLNAILKNIQIYDSYERAFERMDFQKEYEIEKNKKKRTLIRREGMVSLGLLKKQNQEKSKLLSRKSSNKKENDRV